MPLLLEASSLAALPLCRRKWIDFLPLHENLCIVGDRGIVAQSDVERVVWTLGDGLLDGGGLPDLRKALADAARRPRGRTAARGVRP